MLNNILPIGSVIRGEGYMGCIVGLKLIRYVTKRNWHMKLFRIRWDSQSRNA